MYIRCLRDGNPRQARLSADTRRQAKTSKNDKDDETPTSYTAFMRVRTSVPMPVRLAPPVLRKQGEYREHQRTRQLPLHRHISKFPASLGWWWWWWCLTSQDKKDNQFLSSIDSCFFVFSAPKPFLASCDPSPESPHPSTLSTPSPTPFFLSPESAPGIREGWCCWLIIGRPFLPWSLVPAWVYLLYVIRTPYIHSIFFVRARDSETRVRTRAGCLDLDPVTASKESSKAK